MAYGALNNYMYVAAEIGRNPVGKYQTQSEYEDKQADEGRECRNRLARLNSHRLERGQGNNHFSCSAGHEQDCQPYPVDPYSGSMSPVLSTCPLHTNSGCGKERRILIGPWRPAKAGPV